MVTCETHLDIAKLTIEEFIKNSTDLEIKKYITSNSFNETKNFDGLDVELLDSKIPFSHGGLHFGETVLSALKKINSEYILFFLDDMCLINKIKKNNLKKILNVMTDKSIDYYSIVSWDFDWEILDINYEEYDLENNSLLSYDDKFRYMYSVHPCIWKRTSLITILENNRGISGNLLDNTNIKNLKGEIRKEIDGNYWETNEDFWDYGFTNICSKRNKYTSNFAFDDHNGYDDYFIMLYSEILRFGKFNFNTHHNNKKFLDSFLKDKKIDNTHPIYGKFF